MVGSLDTFNSVFPILADDLRSVCCEQYRLPEKVWKWLERYRLDDEEVYSLLLPARYHSLASYNTCIAKNNPWIQSLIQNALGGKCNRGLSVVDTAQLILDRDLTADEYFQTATLGWMVEFLQAMMLVVDDNMDHSETRRGRPCWYLLPGVGMQVADDAPILESAIYVLLKKYLKGHRAYVSTLSSETK